MNALDTNLSQCFGFAGTSEGAVLGWTRRHGPTREVSGRYEILHPAERISEKFTLKHRGGIHSEHDTLDAANAVYAAQVESRAPPLPNDEIEEADAILREACAKFWNEGE